MLQRIMDRLEHMEKSMSDNRSWWERLGDTIIGNVFALLVLIVVLIIEFGVFT